MSERLAEHLHETEVSASNLFERFTSQMMEAEGLSEQLKLEDQMAWVRAVNNIHHRATEIVKAELIHT